MSALSIDGDIDAFIDTQLALLKAYDATRKGGQSHNYEFDKHSVRVADDMHALALRLKFSEQDAHVLKRLTLVHDIGKARLPAPIWDISDKPDKATRDLRLTHTSEGVSIVDQSFGADDRRPVLELMRDMMAHHHETMNGKGYLGKSGDELSLAVRMLCVCDSYDGYSVQRDHFKDRDLSPEGVVKRMRVEKSGQYDPEILAHFAEMKTKKPAPSPRTRSTIHAKL